MLCGLSFCIFFFVLVVSLGTYFAVKFRRKKTDRFTSPKDDNKKLELAWTIIPSIILLVIFVWGFKVYLNIAVTPSRAMEIKVTGQKWFWTFGYPNGVVSSGEMVVPVNKPVNILLSSKDVLHSFFIPAFRVKQDVIPNETINFEFTPILEGKYRLRDSQYSGTYFAAMQTDVVVESPEKYQQWLKEAKKRKPSPAYNQATVEYQRKSDQAIDTNWATVKPAEPPVVNYHD